MKPTNPLIIMLAAVCLLVSCKKDNDGNPLHGTWKTTSFLRYYTEPVVNTVDLHNTQPVCSQDDLLVLRADNTFEFNEGAAKCDPVFPHVKESGTYQVTDNNTKFTLSNGYSVEIQELTDSKLVYKYTYTGPGSKFYDIRSLVRQ